MISEFFRTYIAGLLSPTSFLGVMLIIGTILLWKKKQRSGKIIITISAIGFLLLTTAPLKTILYSFIEVPAVKIPSDYKYVVVLGGKIFPNDAHPVSSQLTPSVLGRLSHGVALTLKNPDSILIVTGNGSGEVPEAIRMKEFAQGLGVPEERIVVEKESMNTSEHPVYLKSILKDQKFLIVTSAYHMKRALLNFRAHGLEGIPAPTDYMNKRSDGLEADSIIMRGENLSAMDRIMTEFYSTIWTAIRKTYY